MHREQTMAHRRPLTTEIAFLSGLLDSRALTESDRTLLHSTLAVLNGIQPYLEDAVMAAE